MMNRLCLDFKARYSRLHRDFLQSDGISSEKRFYSRLKADLKALLLDIENALLDFKRADWAELCTLKHLVDTDIYELRRFR